MLTDMEKFRIVEEILGHTLSVTLKKSLWKCPNCGRRLIYPLDYNGEPIEMDSMTDICLNCKEVWQIRSFGVPR